MKIDLPYVAILTHGEAAKFLQRKHRLHPRRISGIVRRLFLFKHEQRKIIGVCYFHKEDVHKVKKLKVGDYFIK
jgi:hypothetical protein